MSPQPLVKPHWQTTLADYITALAWTADGSCLATCSAAGEVVIYSVRNGQPMVLQEPQGLSADALGFSANGQFLAAGKQDGTVTIWPINQQISDPITELKNPRVWVDRLAWNPRYPELAFNLGRYVQVWDAVAQTVVMTLDFEASSVLDLAWHPTGEYLSVAGNQSVKTWSRQNGYDDPEIRETGGASGAIAWSADGQYLASGNNDRTLLVWDWANPYPWQMQGFPGKVRQLVWSMPETQTGAPLLASSSAESVVIWAKAESEAQGWNSNVLDLHSAPVTAVAFQPQSMMLASAAEDGWVCLWQEATQAVQILEGAPDGFSALAWSPQGKYLAAGGRSGEVLVWAQTTTGRGFGG
jgi:WD40 repeat protein